ncbi:MAG: hypothetical protein Kow0089_18270 [Desulfobulbaceae bacterium]
MNILVIDGHALSSVLARELERQGHAVTLAGIRSLPQAAFDLGVDPAARSIGGVRAVMEGKARIGHYVLVSSCRVYPDLERLAPWRPEEIDLCDETGFSTVDETVRGLRAAERELFHLGSRGIPWTILRPALVEAEGANEPSPVGWLAARIRDGGPLVLPDTDDPLFRLVPGSDLASAILHAAGKEEMFFQALNVTGPSLHTPQSCARLLMEVLEREVPIVRVDAGRWHGEGLGEPIGPGLWSSFIAESLLLRETGWRPAPEKEWLGEIAARAAATAIDPVAREKERALASEREKAPVPRGQWRRTAPWRLVGTPGEPDSFRLEDDETVAATPLLRSRRVALGMAAEQVLTTPSTGKTPRVLGNNVLLEVIDPGGTDLEKGGLFLPVAGGRCGERGCAVCAGRETALPGVDVDGYARSRVSLPGSHLVAVPPHLAEKALLAHPLALALEIFSLLPPKIPGPLWVYGDRCEALLAIHLAREQGYETVWIDRGGAKNGLLPGDVPGVPPARVLKGVREGKLAAPGCVLNLSGAREGENILVRALAEQGWLVSPYVSTGKRKHRQEVSLPPAATGRKFLEEALQLLASWSSSLDTGALLREVEFACPEELFFAAGFVLPFVAVPEEVS